MKYRKLGSSDIEVSAICYGCWAIAGGYTGSVADRADFIAALRAAFDAGVTFYDTAEMYGDGESERILGDALGDRRDEIVITSKVSADHFTRDRLFQACEESLAKLKTDYLDLYLLHWPNSSIPIEETIGVLDELKSAGKIRAHGVSNFGIQDLSELAQKELKITANQLAYNLLFRAVEFEIQPFCVEQGIGILTYSSLMQGLLAGKFRTADEVPEARARTRLFSGSRPQAKHGESGHESEVFAAIDRIREIAGDVGQPVNHVALAWLMAQPAVSSIVVNARNTAQVKDNIQAAEVELSTDVLDRLSRATESVKAAMGPNADMWMAGENARIH